MSERRHRRDGTQAALAALVAVFLFSRLWYRFSAGLRFDTRTLNSFVQFMDPALLKTDLLRTILYMHTQPPLFNLGTGVLLKMFPGAGSEFSMACYLAYSAMGLAFTLSLYLLMVSLGARRSLAFLITALHTVSPTTVRYEHWFFYSYPVATGLCLSALFLHRTMATRRSGWALLYFLSLATLSLTRSTMTWLWFVLCAAVVIAAAREDRNRFLRLSLVPGLLVAALCARQLVLFGSLTTGDAFAGGNLSEKLAKTMSEEQRDDLLKRKVISPLFFVLLHSDIEVVKSVVPPLRPTGIPVLDADRKSTGFNNFNNLHYREMSIRQFSEARGAMLAYPLTYLRSVGNAVVQSFAPASNDYWLRKMVRFSESGERVANLWDTLVAGHADSRGKPAWLLAVSLPLLLVFGVARVFRGGDSMATRITIGFMVFNILFVTALTCAVSVSDFNRYRFDIDSFYAVLLALALSRMVPGGAGPEGLPTPPRDPPPTRS